MVAAGVSNDECVVLAAEIDLTPDPLTADGDPAFTFSSLTGVKPALGFECQLRSSNDAAPPAWQACESPKQYTGLQDGDYTFYVRISGEDLADSFEFFVDKSPPDTEFIEVRLAHIAECLRAGPHHVPSPFSSTQGDAREGRRMHLQSCLLVVWGNRLVGHA